MPVLILKNVPNEGPGTIEGYLRGAGIGYRIIDLTKEVVPATSQFDAVVILGGPMSVNDTDQFPYISREIDLVKEFIAQRKRVLGVCLGAQIMAKALGAAVYPGPEKEIGWLDIEIVGSGLKDPLMNRLATHPRAGDFWRKFKVFHWHGETFDLPAGAELLARSALYPHQAFRYGDGAYAFQFHIEVTKGIVAEWLASEPVDLEGILRETGRIYADYQGRAEGFYKSFFQAYQEPGRNDTEISSDAMHAEEARR